MSTPPRFRLIPALLLLAAPTLAAAQAPRDPAVPYASWGEAQREAADAIAGRKLARPADGRYRVGDAVIVDDENGKVYRAHVILAEDTRYRVRYDGFGPENVRYYDAARILGYQPGVVAAPASAPPSHAASASAVPSSAVPSSVIGPGKWGCTESYWRVTKATYDFEMRGSFTLAANGTYDYPGQGSRGRWRWDAATSAVRFTGGFFDGARAVRIEDSNRIRLELPTNDPQRPRKWSCGPV
ncbi:hypothetical protein [Roseisolibacter agri]|nr:hypothetical protein [Roseisolibacter agri]